MKDHKTPNLYPQRVYPNGRPNKILNIHVLYVMIGSIILFVAYKFIQKSSSSKDNIPNDTSFDDEYEPLIKSAPNSYDTSFESKYQ